MVDTATALRDISDRTIILTGALPPRSMRHSDAAFNIGLALGAPSRLAGGIGQQLFKSRIPRYGESQKVDVSVEGVLRITLAAKAVSQQSGYTGWGAARLTSQTPLAC
jgi:hypothetical protein